MAVGQHLDWASVLLGKTPGAPSYDVSDLFRHLNAVPVAGFLIPILTIAHCCNVFVGQHREARRGFHAKIGLRQSFLSFMVGATGGSVMLSLLLARPISVFNVSTLPALVGVWAALTYIDPLFYLVAEVAFINAQVALLASVNRAACLCGGVEAALRVAPGEYILAVVCGIVASSGGGVLVDMFQLNRAAYGIQQLNLGQRLRDVAALSLIHSFALTPWSLSQGPWNELAMLCIVLSLGCQGLWACFTSHQAKLALPPKLRKLTLKKRE